ncbi:flagellar hook-associated protein FlgK [Alphaproteobacteria bacterium]|nr:flagellar hook-associated protein FlgK [Alphaproteobacteria bacterium]
MASLFDIGKSGLQSYRQALSVTGQNIANINTDGYKRREATLEEVAGSQGGVTSVATQNGLGVRVTDIRRSFDEFLLNKTRSATAYAQTSTSYLSAIEQLENLLLPGDSNLGNALNTFFGGLNEVSAAPSDLSPRVVAMEQGRMLAGTFNQLSATLKELQAGVVSQTNQKMAELNILTGDLVELNKKLSGNDATKAQNSLLDARDNLLDQISEYAEVAVTLQKSGKATVNLGKGSTGPVLVTGDQQTTLGAEELDMVIGFRLNPNTDNIPTSQMTNGSLRGLADAYQLVTKTIEDIDNLAYKFARDVNMVHRGGLDLDGLAGGDMFAAVKPVATVAANNRGTSAATIAVSNASLIEPDKITFIYNDTTAKWTGRNERGSIVASGAKTIDLPGASITFSAGAKDGDEFVYTTAKGAAASITMTLQRAQEIAAASTQLVYADSANNSTASISIAPATQTTSDTLSPLDAVLGNGVSTIGAGSFLRDGSVAIIPANASAVDLLSLTQQSTAKFVVTDAELADLNGFDLAITDSDGTTKTYSFSTKYSDIYDTGSFTDASDLADLINQGAFTATNGVDFENNALKKFTLRDLGGFVSGEGGSVTFSIASGDFATSSKVDFATSTDRTGAVTARNDTASTIQIFTRDGRHLAGTALSSAEQTELFTAANGFSTGAVYNSTYLNVDNGYLGMDVAVASGAANTLMSLTGTGATRDITFNRLEAIDTDEASASGGSASAESASYSLTIGIVTKTVTAANFGRDASASNVAKAMAAAFRADAPPAVMSGSSVATIPADGSSAVIAFEGQNYTLTMSAGEVVVSGGETGRINAYFDANKILQIASNGGTLTASAISVPDDDVVSNNASNALNFGLTTGDGAVPAMVGFGAYDYNIVVDGAKLTATNTDSSQAITVATAGTSMLGERVTLSDLPDEELIVVLDGGGARRLTTNYDLEPVTTATLARDMTVKVTDAANNIVELIDTETSVSLATLTLDSDGVATGRGITFTLSGTLADNDKFHISANQNAGGDNRNMDALLDLQTANGARGGFQQVFAKVLSGVGVGVQSSRLTNDAAVALRDASIEKEAEFSGVNLDTEAANLIEQQQAYQASARILTTARELFRTLIDAV